MSSAYRSALLALTALAVLFCGPLRGGPMALAAAAPSDRATAAKLDPTAKAPATAPAATQPATALARAKALMQAREYVKALAELDKHLAGKPKDADEAQYLKALCLYYDVKGPAAIEAAEVILTQYKDSPWASKALFLKAAALVAQKNYKAAEEIYDAEAHRLLGAARKREIAAVIIQFADALTKKPDPADIGAPPPNYQKAYNLYRKTLQMEIARDLQDEVMFKAARTIQQAGQGGQAIADYQAYLKEFDPDWSGPVGSQERALNLKKENPPPAGVHLLDARYCLAEALLTSGQFAPARQELEDLRTLVNIRQMARLKEGQIGPAPGDVAWMLLRTYQMPNPRADELDKAVQAARDFLNAFPNHPHAVEAAWGIPESYRNHGRADQAVAAYEEFIAAKGYALPEGPDASKRLEGLNKTPAELKEEWTRLAVYQIGQIRFDQKQYPKAIEQWQSYVAKYPNGPQWAASQMGIVNAEFQAAVELVADKKYDDARREFDAFLEKHPLDGRVPQVLFIYGQVHYAAAQKLEEDKAEAPRIAEAYRKAIDEWSRLVSRFPGNEEASLAQYRIGMIYEEKLGELEKAVEAYRKLTWGSQAPAAAGRVTVMTQKHLAVTTERVFRTSEPAKIKLATRNIEKLTLKLYALDLESYFRKTHGIAGIEALDTALIQPDKVWEIKVEGYAKYKPIAQEIEVPFEAGAPGVYIVNVAEEDFEATTLVLRSDLDLILKSSRREALVFVEDMVKKQPAEGVDLLLSDGSKVFATGKTGKDGVFKGKFNELKDGQSLRVFASRQGHAASNLLSLANLGFSQGLSPKGYIYTDRPAYQPGQSVAIRGVIRIVKDGSYAAPKDEPYLFSVTDAQGRMLWQDEKKLSEFGTFDAKMTLDESAALGQYTVTARPKQEGSPLVFSGVFQVKQFQLEKMRLTLEAPRQVYFRGETVELAVAAEYYWGQPAADKPVRYTLPDGKSFVQKTDAQGKLKVTFDTTGMQPGATLVFSAAIEGENVAATASVFLARLAYTISVSPSQSLALAGEPFDVTLKAIAPDGKAFLPTEPLELNLIVLRRQTVKPDPVLAGVPWVQLPAQAASEVTVKEEKVAIDPKTGQAAVHLSLEGGGLYILRATGKDQFNQAVTGESSVTVSDATDATKLRFFADTATLKVGDKAKIRLHSRLDGAIALLTFEGEEVIDYKLLTLKKDYNDIEIAVGHEHFPNFAVAAAAMDGKELRTASKGFNVERELKVSLKPLKDVYGPGEQGQVEITVTDQLGKPVKAELSLALVDEALLAIFADSTPRMLDFFQASARRAAEFRVASSCGFSYAAQTRAVVKAYEEEAQRIARAEEQAKRIADIKATIASGELVYDEAKGRELAKALGPAGTRDKLDLGGVEKNLEKAAPAAPAAPTGAIQPAAPAKPGEAADGLTLGGMPGRGGGGTAPPEPVARKELAEAGFWTPSIVTDAQGKAVVSVPMPQTTTRWRMISRGCTVETLVGEATGNVVTRKDFFVEIKIPASFQEGDKIRVLARVHNMADYEGPVELTLKLQSAAGDRDLAKLTQKAQVSKKSTVEVLFDELDVPPEAKVNLLVEAQAGELKDAVVRALPVRPWGMEYASSAGGTSTGDAQVTVELPSGQPYKSVWMTVSVGPSLQRAVIDMAMGPGYRPMPMAADHTRLESLPPPPNWGRQAGSDLLAAAAAIEYAKAVKAPAEDYRRLMDRARALASSLVVCQQVDGGWLFTGKGESDWAISAMNFWALAAARPLGVAVNEDTMKKAQTFLQNVFTRVAANDNDARAVILQALSVVGAADFANVNRLYRERNALSNPALAYTALAMVNLGRKEIAGELLDVLESKAKTPAPTVLDGRKLANWDGAPTPWLSDPTETTAVALLAMVKVRPQSPKVKEAADYLLQQRGCYGYTSAKAQGPAVAALAAYFAQAKFAATQYRLAVQVNNKDLKTVECQSDQPTFLLSVPAEMIVTGKNRVDFRMEGKGEYAYAVTLRGFSPQINATNQYHRYYYHAPLEYRGRPLGPESSSPVKNAEIGQRIQVITTWDYWTDQYRDRYVIVEEPLPAGTVLVDGSLSGNFTHYETGPSKIILYFRPNTWPRSVRYQLVGYSTGCYRALPTVVRDVTDPGRMSMGGAGDLVVLAPGEASKDPYQWNPAEKYAMGAAYFNDGLYREALKYLTESFRPEYERDVARMLLWIYTSGGDFYDARQIVKMFEVLRERYPDLVIPFDKILVVGRAYCDIGEFERAWFVFRAAVDASFISDSNVSAVLQDEGQFLASIDFQEDLWREYPDTPEVVGAYFALSQLLYQKAPQAPVLAKEERRIALARGQTKVAPQRVPDKVDMLKETIRMLSSFMTLYADNPLADDAAFSMANALLELKQYPVVVEVSVAAQARYPKSDFLSSFQYMTALGYFWQRNYDSALTAARAVASGESKDRDFARYILGQIYHAEGKPADAIGWYHQVDTLYPDAKEAISYFEEKRIKLEEVNIFRPGQAVEIKLDYRNIKEATMQVYRVDLMKLYLREKNLAGVTKVNLSGIKPEAELTVKLGDGKDYVDKQKTAKLPVDKEAAYLVICRGDDLFTSAVVLITPLKIEVQEDPVSGRLRANILDAAQNLYVPEVHVKAIGSADSEFKSGQTDLRGIFIADGLRGKATVIARVGESRYAFYRGEKWLGEPAAAPPKPLPAQPNAGGVNYNYNLDAGNRSIQEINAKNFDSFRRQSQRGVEAQRAQ